MTEDRRIEVAAEVAATPEQVWEAIATGPGISAWFMPAEVDGRVGGEVVHRHDGETQSTGRITAYDPPRRFGYEESEVGATEFLVEARSGGTCVVRIVMSGLRGDWGTDEAVESFRSGWTQALSALRLYLAHFAGRPAHALVAGETVPGGDKDAIWQRLTDALGIPADPRPGTRMQTTSGPRLAGTVEEARDRMITLVLDEPAAGIGFLGTGGPGDEAYTFVRAQLFGEGAAEVAGREQAAWREWFAARAAPAP